MIRLHSSNSSSGRCLALIAVLITLVLEAASARAADAPAGLHVKKLGDPGPFEIVDGAQPVLRYNYQVVTEPAGVKARVSEANRKYAVDRADYIHPLYGPHGEVLTEDWSIDHPHHRGIYWAWPEVTWHGQLGDLHALQLVFARPTGKVETKEGPDFAEITAESQWLWEGKTPIVREEAAIRVGKVCETGRPIDLTFRFTALGDDVFLARREQTHYGGLNLRFSAARDQQIETFTAPAGASPRAAWSQRSGTPNDGKGVVGVTTLQSPLNPDYPGDWAQFPEISWAQPTFPTSGTRFVLKKDKPLELQFRLWVHEGKLTPEVQEKLWADYAASAR